MGLTKQEKVFNERLAELGSMAVEEFDIQELIQLRDDVVKYRKGTIGKFQDVDQLISNLNDCIDKLSPLCLALEKAKEDLQDEMSNSLDNSFI